MSNKKESKQKKMTVRVDFTPMVDMFNVAYHILHALYFTQ